jgi:cyclic beta-1,2-glucan synthetase
MEYESREDYRKVIGDLARNSGKSETDVAEAAVGLAVMMQARAVGGRAWERRIHVGFYLIDAGLPALRKAIGYKHPITHRIRDLVLEYPNAFYLIGIEISTFLIVVGLLSGLAELTPIVAGLFLLMLPATQAAVDFMNNLTSFLVPPRALPKLDFSEGVPSEYATMVAVPTLLLNERQVRELVNDLEIRYLANRDPNLYFALVTDSPDADKPVDERDVLVGTCRGLIEGLNERYGKTGRGQFFLFHRHRIYNPSEGRWMGWERKRGKLLDLNQLLRGGFDSFPVKVGDESVLPQIQYIITLDSDTQLPRNAAARLVGTIAHPLNRAVLDVRSQTVVEGYGILQPRIGISIQSAATSRLASIYSGQTGFDIYTRAISDVYQDLFGEGIFTGKGIYEIDALRHTLEFRFPDNSLLSHDLIEGAYARAGLVSDIELIDDYPSHFSAYSRRKHRWVRGDWQIMRWVLPRVPDYQRKIGPNPITLISRWKIVDNLRRSLFEPATLILLLAGWMYLPGEPWYWTLASILLLLMPTYSNLLFSILRAPVRSPFFKAWLKDTALAVLRGHFHAFLNIVFLLHQALLSVDAIGRSMMRVFVTKRKLLEWETAAEAESALRRKSKVDVYLEWSPWLALLIGVAVTLIRPRALPVALPILALWFGARLISAWLNRAPRAPKRALGPTDEEFLRTTAERMWQFYREWSSPATNWLIPDHVLENGKPALRLSPTNLGFLLNARIAAVHFGWLSPKEFVEQTALTLDTVERLPKFKGHLLNWYDVETLAVLEPRFVSSVDSGNLAGCLWALKQAVLALAAEHPDLAPKLQSIAERAHRLVDDMDFAYLYQRRKKIMSVGYDVSTGKQEPSAYDLLASESRIGSFVAIAKSDIPQDAWFHLGRRHTVCGGERVLVSWTGTMFEYLMPAIWMRHFRDTIMYDSMHGAVRVQCKYGKERDIPWGISESACAATTPGGEYGYAPFGVPELAMKESESEAVVVSPYSSFLALMISPASAMKNIRKMDRLGWQGKYGFYEAVDYSSGTPEVIRSWMAHHLGMSLLSVCNVLFDNPFQQYFHAEPQVLATELLLHERVPSAIVVEAEEIPPPPVPLDTAA